MKILVIGNEIRHKLGCAVSLVLQGYKVSYLHVGEKHASYSNVMVHIDGGSVTVPFSSIKSPSLPKLIISGNEFVPRELRDECFDLVATTPLASFYIAYQIAKKQKSTPP